MDFVLQYSDCYYDAIGEAMKTEAGNSVAVSSAMLEEMTSHAVLVKHETEFGDWAYSVDAECQVQHALCCEARQLGCQHRLH